MFIRIFTFLLIIAGAIFMCFTVRDLMRFFRFQQKANQDGADKKSSHYIIRAVILAVSFVVGYLIGAMHALYIEISPIYVIASIIFFMGGIFIFMLVNFQLRSAAMVAEKEMSCVMPFWELKTLIKTFSMKSITRLVKSCGRTNCCIPSTT